MAVAGLNRYIVGALQRKDTAKLRETQTSADSEKKTQMRSLAPHAGRLVTSRSSEAAAATVLRAHHDVCSALPAAGHTDRVFKALHSVRRSEAPLYRRLANIRRKNLSRCRRTIHIKTGAVQCCLNRHSLLALNHLLLRLASHGGKHAG